MLRNIDSHFLYVCCLVCSCVSVLIALQMLTAFILDGWVSDRQRLAASCWAVTTSLSSVKEPLPSRQALTS